MEALMQTPNTAFLNVYGYYTFDIETMGFDPFYNRIICIGLKDGKTSETIVFSDDDESVLLSKFSKFLGENRRVLVGYNIYSFDIYFIKMRALINKIPIIFPICIDIFQTLNPSVSSRSFKKLADWAFVLDLGKGEGTGSLVPLQYDRGEKANIISHMVSDLELIDKVFKRMQEVKII